MSWYRFPVWDRWGDLTRFRVALENALVNERALWDRCTSENHCFATSIYPDTPTQFQCSVSDYKISLNNDHCLYSMLLTAYTGLVEEHARNLLEYLLTEKNTPRTDFPGMNASCPANQAAEKFIKENNIEIWSDAIFKSVRRSWGELNCKKSIIV